MARVFAWPPVLFWDIALNWQALHSPNLVIVNALIQHSFWCQFVSCPLRGPLYGRAYLANGPLSAVAWVFVPTRFL